jgi:hypothetical protein
VDEAQIDETCVCILLTHANERCRGTPLFSALAPLATDIKPWPAPPTGIHCKWLLLLFDGARGEGGPAAAEGSGERACVLPGRVRSLVSRSLRLEPALSKRYSIHMRNESEMYPPFAIFLYIYSKTWFWNRFRIHSSLTISS